MSTSRTAVTWVNTEQEIAIWNANHDLRGSDVLVLLTLNTFADRATGRCWPSMPQIAARSRLNEKTIRTSLSHLEELGLIESETRPGATSIITLTPTESGGTENGRGTEIGTTENGTHPTQKRYGTPTKNGRRTNRSQERSQEDSRIDVPWWVSKQGFGPEDYWERKDEPGWAEAMEAAATRKVGAVA